MHTCGYLRESCAGVCTQYTELLGAEIVCSESFFFVLASHHARYDDIYITWCYQLLMLQIICRLSTQALVADQMKA